MLREISPVTDLDLAAAAAAAAAAVAAVDCLAAEPSPQWQSKQQGPWLAKGCTHTFP